MRLIDADALRATLHKHFRDKSPLPRLTEAYHADVMGAIKNAPTVTAAVQWHNAKTDPPKEPGSYMTFRRIGGVYNLYQFLDWTNDLYTVNDYDFSYKKNCPGWYDEDPETGYYSVKVEYWAELPTPPEVKE